MRQGGSAERNHRMRVQEDRTRSGQAEERKERKDKVCVRSRIDVALYILVAMGDNRDINKMLRQRDGRHAQTGTAN